MHRGWVRLYRKLADNPLWTEETFTHGQAWIDLILIANYRKGHIRVRGVRVDIERGQVGHSENTLAERWKWSKGKVRRFLSELQTDGMIVQQKSTVMNLIIIINYDEHQTDGNTDGKADSNTDGLQTVTQTDTNKKDKNIKKEKKEDISPLIKEIIDDLNEVCGKRFSHTTDETVKFINGRLSEGKTLDDFKRVHRIQAHEWKGDAKFDQYLRPNTLYRPGKFESYMNKKTPEEIEQARKNSARIRQLKGKVEDAMEDIEKLTASLLGMPEEHENYKPYHARIAKASGFIERTEAEIKRLEG